jgi:hypothetical protein
MAAGGLGVPIHAAFHAHPMDRGSVNDRSKEASLAHMAHLDDPIKAVLVMTDPRRALDVFTLLHGPRLSQYDCCLPFPCMHAQIMQHCQHPHIASNFLNLTWAGQHSATLCLPGSGHELSS